MPEPIIVRDPDICGGVPCVRGTRMQVAFVRERVTRYGWHGFATEHPDVSDMLTDDDRAAIDAYPQPTSATWHVGDDDAIDIDELGVVINGCVVISSADIPALIAALTEAHRAYLAWEAAVEQWEQEHGGAE